jgi:threonylcarbamoyladenosine tRNA methylthiotransferase CDKAL1
MPRVKIETYGCSMNKAASEVAAGLLSERGYEISGDDVFDAVIVNTCTVKTPTETKIIKRLESLLKDNIPVVVAGCLPGTCPGLAERFASFSFVGTNILDLPEALDGAIKGRRLVKIESGGCGPGHNRKRDNPVIGVIPISQGCLGNCSYCLVKKARGDLNSFTPEDIVKDVKSALSEGVREIWITSQDCGCYGMDIGTNLPDLLRRVCALDGEYMIRAGMMNPNHALAFLDELIEAYKHPRVYKFLHIPVQSGDDKVLKDMNRFYTVKDFKKIVKEFRKEIPKITISTDIIAGFPTEDDSSFQRSLDLLEDTRPDVLNISRFWVRSGTEAAKMKQLHGRVTNQRSRRVAEAFNAIALVNNKKWIGWEGRVLVSEKGKRGDFCARNYAYKPVILKDERDIMGRFLNVRIMDATRNDLRGDRV